MLSLTRATPKELLPLGRMPVLQRIVEELQRGGIDDVVIVTSPTKPAIEKHFRGFPGVRFAYQSEPLGLGHAVLAARDLIEDDSFVVALADAPLSGSHAHELVPALLRAQADLSAAAVIAADEVALEDTYRRGILVPQADPAPGRPVRLRDMVEKPAPGAAPGRLASACRYVFTPAIFNALAQTAPDADNEIQLTDAIRRLIRSGWAVYALPLAAGQVRHDTGNIDGYRRAVAAFTRE